MNYLMKVQCQVFIMKDKDYKVLWIILNIGNVRLTWGFTGKILSTSLLYRGRKAEQHQQQPDRNRKKGNTYGRRMCIREMYQMIGEN